MTNTNVCNCNVLLDSNDDPETGVHCRCLAKVTRRGGSCAECKLRKSHVDTTGKRVKIGKAITL